ncbi:MAG: helix-turn-helix transcriptional regulator [Acidobacteria bacterium]|nr:helix-turn-helix transcriptional regulator [Acidobacteriota bacterium]
MRRSRGLPSQQLADKLGIKRSLIDYYETRSPNLALDFIERSAAALEVSVAELLGASPMPDAQSPAAVAAPKKVRAGQAPPRDKQIAPSSIP